ncbi:MAG: hypothetical protein QNJ65_00350 [Xenococcaceae cyanobacterium MO_234.B1]|nr:hypothetical protein [Xenococcaceae cyanobacterium MO_234.B1]
MKTLNQLTSVRVTVLISIGCVLGVAPSLTAQVPSTPKTESNNRSLEDLSDVLNQMAFWTCLQGDKKIKVDAQNESFLQETIEGEGWKCSQAERIPTQVSDEIQFSCEPLGGTLGIVTVTWLEGEGGKEQMQAWMEKMDSKPDQGCQMSQVEPYNICVTFL